MKINEVRTDINEDLRGAIYRASGGMFGGIKGQQSAIKSNYITRFINQLKLNTQAAKRAGQTFDMKSFLDRYINQYGWDLNDKEQASLDKMSDAATMTNNSNQSLTSIANYMYMLASQNQGTKPGDRSSKPTKARPSTGIGGGAAPPPPAPSPTSGSSEKVTVGGQTLDPKNPADAKILQQIQQQQAGAASGATSSAAPQPTAKQQAGEPISPTAEKIMAAIGSLKGPTTKEDLDTILRDAAYLLSRIDKPRYANTLRELTAGVSGTAAAGTKASMYSDTQQKTAPDAPQQYKDIEQAMPGYGRATDDLSNKMKPSAPSRSSAERAFRPGSRKPEVTTAVPRMKK